MLDFTQCESGQTFGGTHEARANLAPFPAVDGQSGLDTQPIRAVNSDLIAAIVETYRQRVDLHRAEKSLTL